MAEQLAKRLVIGGTEFKLAVNQSGKGVPTEATQGLPGVLYMDEETGAVYKCMAADVEAGRYTWVEFGLDGIPNYWKPHLAQKISLIRETMLAAGVNKSAFFFYSDSHWSNETTYTAKMAPALLKYLCKNTPINKTNFGGDIVNAEGTDADTMDYLWEWRKLLYGLPNHHSVPGNHDDGNTTNNLFPEEYVYGYLLAPEESPDIVRGDAGMYYYIDNPAEKTRYLYLDTAYRGVTDAEQAFVKSALLDTPAYWHIVAIAHAWYENDYTTYPPVLNGFDTNAKKLLDMFDQYNARSGDYAACGGKVVLCIGGHYHLDHAAHTDGGIPVIIVEADTLHDRSGTMPKKGTTDEAAVSAVIVDYNENVVKIIRVGRGDDFVVSIDGGDTVVYYSVTSNLNNAALSSDVTRIESNASYTATLTATAGTFTDVTITMGGKNITDTVYDVATGTITIEAVTGNIIITAVAKVTQTTSYTNVIPISIGSDGKIFNGGKGWADNSRIGSGTLDNYIGDGSCCITGHISIDPTIENVIRLRNIIFNQADTSATLGLAFYNASFARVSPNNDSSSWLYPKDLSEPNGYEPVLDTDGNFLEFTLKPDWHTKNEEIRYFAICAAYIGDDSIITINEEITD